MVLWDLRREQPVLKRARPQRGAATAGALVEFLRFQCRQWQLGEVGLLKGHRGGRKSRCARGGGRSDQKGSRQLGQASGLQGTCNLTTKW